MKKIVVIDVEEPKRSTEEESKFNKFKRTAKEKFEAAKVKLAQGIAWVQDHPEDVKNGIATVGAAALAIGALKKRFGKTKAQKERERIDHTYYDPRTGLHWQLKRPLSNAERSELELRLRNGERAGEVLRSMRVLRR